MANALLEQRHQFGAFALLPMHVSSDGLVAFVAALRQVQNFSGAVVSRPHKSIMAELVDELTEEGKLVGAVNVIRRRADGWLVGTILDGEGFVGGLKDSGHRVAGTSCLLVGAGGAASAIAFSLAKHGCSSICVANRTRSKAESLAERVRQAFPGVDVTTEISSTSHFDISINGTSLGMNPADELPFSSSVVERSSLVAECVIAPEMTRLLETAKNHGCAIHTGVPMLAAQMEMMLSFMGTG